MRNYELVCVINPMLSAKETTEQKEKIESLLDEHNCTIKEKDEMGLLPLAYPLKGQTQADITSYYCEADPESLDTLKEELGLEKGLAKFFFYAMKEDEEFMKFADMKKAFEEMEKAKEEEVEDDEEDEDDENEEA